MEELHVLLKNRGKIRATEAQDYVDAGGYEGLRKALAMSPEEIIEVVKKAGLRGRGGAGFPTFRKMEFTYHADDPVRYIVCNADEGEPGTNKDRILLSSDPCAIFEGMAIAARAVYAHICAPHYPACAMDGIAVSAADTFGASDTTPISLTP